MNEEFVEKIVTLRGDIGKKWLADLPGIIKKYEWEWELTVLEPFNLTYNYVAPAETKKGEDVVLKISFPENSEFAPEVDALEFYRGIGSIKILNKDLGNGVILLEKSDPGTRIRDITPESSAITEASKVILELHKPFDRKNSIFPTVSDIGKAFKRYRLIYPKLSLGPVPRWMFEKAEEFFVEYPKEKKPQVLLHGDLHSDNILLSQRGWLSIDPKGVIGESEYELGAYLRNPIYDYPKGSNYKILSAQRIIQFSEELGFDKNRVLNWTFACAVISILWFLEDENYFKEIYVRNAELLNGIDL